MTMSDITVIIYSYKGKLLKETVDNLIKTSSKNISTDIIILDQHPLMRFEMFKDLNVMYKHIFWDWIDSPCKYKKEVLNNINTKYTMILSDNIILSESWDQNFIDFVKDSKKIISGNHNLTLENDGLFYIKKNMSDISNYYLTQFVDRSLIFGNTDLLKSINYPNYIKYNGEEECLSIQFFTNGIDIYACPTQTYTQIGLPTIGNIYTPFSINHNYNEIIDLLILGKNKYVSLNNLIRSIEDFNNLHNNIFNKIKKLPFQTNDVEYLPQNLNFNNVDARKYIATTRAIH